MHILKTPSQEVPLKWGMYAQRLYCEKYNVPNPIAFFKLFEDELTIQDRVPELLLIAAEYAAMKQGIDKKYTIVDACEWCDECGGFKGEGAIMDAFIYIVSGHKVNLSEENVIATDNIEKKTES